MEVRGVYPNPARQKVNVYVTLTEAANIQLQIYNVAGEPVFEQPLEAALKGDHVLVWQGANRDGTRVASGIYILRLTATGSSGAVLTRWTQAVISR